MERFVLYHRVVPSAREDDFDPSATTSWMRSVSARLAAAGGELLGTIGGAVAALFDLADVNDAVELGLAMLADADRTDSPESSPRIALGASVGPIELVETTGGLHTVGAALDRAQLLANRARVGEFVFDSTARDLAATAYLFQRTVGSGEAQLRGHALDRAHPRLAECRAALVHVHDPPALSYLDDALASVSTLATTPGAALVVVRGPAGIGVKSFLAALKAKTAPALVLRLPGTPGGLEPLGSLRLGLGRAFGTEEALDAALANVSSAARTDVANVVRGIPVTLSNVVKGLGELVDAHARSGAKTWIIVEPLDLVDLSTLEVLAALASLRHTPVLVVIRAHDEAKIPTALSSCATLHEVRASRLRSEDSRTLAELVLGSGTDPEIHRRLAALAGDTPLTVVELARAMVASGDLVRRGRGFAWRAAPRTGHGPTALSTVLGERIASLDSDPLRALELVCAAPPDVDAKVLETLASLDSLAPEALRHAIAALTAERFLHRGPGYGPANDALRTEVLRRMPPSRLAEVCRFVASALAPSFVAKGSFAQSTLGHYLAEGGHGEEGSRLLLEASLLAARAEHARSAVRLAAAAVRANPSNEVRDVSARIMREVVTTPHAEETTRAPREIAAPMATDLTAPVIAEYSIATRTIRALLDRDYDRVERCIDLAIAEGGSLAAAGRIRGVAALCRGDRQSANVALARARTDGHDSPKDRIRDDVASGWLRLLEGDVHGALRSALAALASARTSDDEAGESAALRTLAACYRLLGRDGDAASIRGLAARVA